MNAHRALTSIVAMNTWLFFLGCAASSPSPPERQAPRVPVHAEMATEAHRSAVGQSTLLGAPEWEIEQVSAQGLLFVHPRLGVQLRDAEEPDPTAWVAVPDPEWCGPTHEPTVLRCIDAHNPARERSYIEVHSGQILARFTPKRRGNEESVAMEGGWLIQQDGPVLYADNLFTQAHLEHTLQGTPSKLEPLSKTHLAATLPGYTQVVYLGGGKMGDQFRAKAPIASSGLVLWFEPGVLILQSNAGRTHLDIPHAIHRRSLAISGDGREVGITVQQHLPDQSFRDRSFWYRLGPEGWVLLHEAPGEGASRMLPTPHSVVSVEQDEERLVVQGPGGAIATFTTGAYAPLMADPSGARWVWGPSGPVIDTTQWRLSGPRSPHPGRRLKTAISADSQWAMSCAIDRDRVAIWRDSALAWERKGALGACLDLHFSKDGGRALASSQVIDLPSGEVLLDLSTLALPGDPMAAALSPSGERLAIFVNARAQRENRVVMVSVPDGAVLWTQEISDQGLSVLASLAFTQGGAGLAVGRAPRELTLLDSATGRIERTQKVGNGVGYVRSDGQDRLAVVTGIHGGPQLLHVFQGGKRIYRQADVSDAHFDPQGRLVLRLAGTGDTVYQRRDLDSGQVQSLTLPLRPWTHAASEEMLLVGVDGAQLWLQGWGEE